MRRIGFIVLAIAMGTAAPCMASVPPVDASLEKALALVDSEPEKARPLLAALLPNLPKGAARNQAAAKLCILTAVADATASLPIARQGLADARAGGDRKAESQLLRCEGYAQESLGNQPQAAVSYAAAVAAAEASGDREALADALVSRGELRHFNGEYDGAIADLKRSYDLCVQLGLDGGQRYALNAMANLYADANVGEYDKAIGYYEELLARHEKAGREGEIATAHFNLGSTLERKGEFALALAHYRKARDIDHKRGDADSVAEEDRVIGAVLVKQGRAKAALPWIDRALAHFRRLDDADGTARVRLTRGIALRAAGQPEAALIELDASRAYFAPTGNQRFLVRIDEERARAYADQGQWQSAHAALAEQFKAQRELDRKLAEEGTSRLRVQFDAERTEQLNRVLQAENRRRGEALRAAERERSLQRMVILLGALLLALLLALAVRQLRKARRLRVLALTDELTGLPNRRNILAFLDEQVRAARRSGQPLSVVSFDIDHFKRINDTHGHDGGDRALKRVAALAGQSLRGSDRLGRVGGEEFLLVLPGTGAATAAEIAERSRRAIETGDFDAVAPGARVTISLGVSAWGDAKDEIDALMKRTDEALYRAKASGRNRVEVEQAATSTSSVAR